MSTSVLVCQFLTFFFAGIIAVTTHAQATIEEVVVTARKRTENLQDVPVAVTAFQGTDLEQRDLADISQLSNLTPNVTLRPTASLSGSSNSSAFFYPGYRPD
jgi:outer membrane receptor protein involved in Fe transport